MYIVYQKPDILEVLNIQEFPEIAENHQIMGKQIFALILFNYLIFLTNILYILQVIS